MADSIDFSLIGVDALLGKMASVSYDIKRRGGRSALRKAAALVVQKARDNAQKIDDADTGRSIADNVALRWNGKLYKRTGDLGFRIGVLQGAVLPKKGQTVDTSAGAATPHWRLIEFGTDKMRAQPFMRRALSENIGEVTNKFLTEYEKALDRAIKRASKIKV